MPAWIIDLLGLLAGPVRRAIDAVGAWVASLWSTLTRVLTRIKDAWLRLYTWIRYGVYWLINGVWEAYRTVRWIVTVWVPMHVRQVKAGILTWTRRELVRLGNLLRGTVDTLRRWATTAVNTVKDAVNRLIGWARTEIGNLWTLARRTATRVFDLLTDPRKLAEWVITAVVGALWRYAYRQRDRIAAWFLRTSPAFTTWLARTLDDVLGRLL